MTTNNSGNINNNQNNNPHKKRKKRKKKKKVWKIILLVLLALILAAVITAGVMVIRVASKAPKIDPTNALDALEQSSAIYDQKGNLVEQIHDAEINRDIVEFKDMPKHLKDAFISIEDKRFEKHFGIDLQRIAGALINNLKSGDMTGQGASTITQQLVKNLYLTNEKALDRKIMEAYLAIQMERKLTKDQILENYLNTIPLGQSTYGVQAAAYAYFSKDVKDLTIAECAALAAIPKSTTKYAPYNRTSIDNLEGVPEDDIVGYVSIDSIQYACVFNETAVERQQLVLKSMYEQGKISKKEYEDAKKEDIKTSLKPGIKKVEGITSNNFTDYVKQQVIEDLMETNDMTYEQAQNYLYRGGLSIYTTMDVDMQKSIETIYDSFGEILTGGKATSAPLLQDWSYFRRVDGESTGSLDKYQNVLNDSGNVLYFKHDNIMDSNNTLYLLPSEYSIDESGNLVITSDKFNLYESTVDIVNCYTIDDKNQLVTHNISGLNVGNAFSIVDKKGVIGTFSVSKSFLDQNKDFYTTDGNNVIYINSKYYTYDKTGIVQPQSATVIMDYKTGQIKALVGGRDIVGSHTFNRAVDSSRQPGSTIKPLGVYLPALDNGYTAASVIDDIPLYDENGKRWPKNWMEYYHSYTFKYCGLVSLRYSVEQSLNTNAVTTLKDIGMDTSVKYLQKLGLVNKDDPEKDTFITPSENKSYNDMNASALALGGFTKGFSPLKIAAAYGAIANDGTYTKPICYTKILDSKGKVLIDNTPKTNKVVSPAVAFIMKDILRTTVTEGLSTKASLQSLGIDVGAKTGTTQDNGDLWCTGFSPYYVASVWVGNDNATMKLSTSSGATANFLGAIFQKIHEGKEPAKFEKPKDVVSVSVCETSGLLPTELCSQDPRGTQVHTEYFVKGTEPTTYCEAHVKREVCADSGLLLTKYCPEGSKTSRVFITRKVLFNPALYPDTMVGGNQKLAQASQLYNQIREDIMKGSTSKDILASYPGQVTLKVTTGKDKDGNEIENIQIETVNGLTPAQLTYKMLVTKDFQYQEPLEYCNVHTYETWYNSVVTKPSEDDKDKDKDDQQKPEDNKDNENPDNNGNNDNNGDNNGNNDNQDDGNNGNNNEGNDDGTGDDSGDDGGNLEIITDGNNN